VAEEIPKFVLSPNPAYTPYMQRDPDRHECALQLCFFLPVASHTLAVRPSAPQATRQANDSFGGPGYHLSGLKVGLEAKTPKEHQAPLRTTENFGA